MALGSLSGLITKKVIALTTAGAVVAGGATAGVIWYINREPKIEVRQRSASVSVPGNSDGAASATCLSHETALSGGFGLSGPAYATTSMRSAPASREWVVGAFNPTDAAVTLTAYVVCVNAKVNVSASSPSFIPAYSDRDPDKILEGATDLTTIEPMKDWHNEHSNPSCPSGSALVGFEFRPGRSASWLDVAPVPLTSLLPEHDNRSEVWTNSGAELSRNPLGLGTTAVTRHTRIHNPQPPEWNYGLHVQAECAQIPKTSLVSATVDVAAGGSADGTLVCPKGSDPVGGGFDFSDHHSFGREETIPPEFIGDGWLFATTNGPARGEPSGAMVRAWYVTGVNQQTAGARFENTAWWHHSTYTGDHDYLFLNNSPSEGDEQFRGFDPIPDKRPMVATAVCATIEATPTAPPKTPDPPLIGKAPVIPGGIDFPIRGPDGVPPTAIIVAASPTAAPSTTTPVPTTTTAPPTTTTTTTTQPPQKPAVGITSFGLPQYPNVVCSNVPTPYVATAVRKPGNQPITDAGHTSWKLTHPQIPDGQLPLPSGTGVQGSVPAQANLPPMDGYQFEFTAVDPVNGQSMTAKREVAVGYCQ